MRCSVFENDENVAGWKAGSSVAYCLSCFEEKMTREMVIEMNGRDNLLCLVCTDKCKPQCWRYRFFRYSLPNKEKCNTVSDEIKGIPGNSEGFLEPCI